MLTEEPPFTRKTAFYTTKISNEKSRFLHSIINRAYTRFWEGIETSRKALFFLRHLESFIHRFDTSPFSPFQLLSDEIWRPHHSTEMGKYHPLNLQNSSACDSVFFAHALANSDFCSMRASAVSNNAKQSTVLSPRTVLIHSPLNLLAETIGDAKDR